MIDWNSFLSPYGLAVTEIAHRHKRHGYRIYHSLPEEELWRFLEAAVKARYPKLKNMERELHVTSLLDYAARKPLAENALAPGAFGSCAATRRKATGMAP